MDVRLTVIGSSPAWPNPGSAHSGHLVEEAGKRLLLDCGPGVLGRLRSLELLPVDAIAITHFHLDHWGDLVPWVWFARHGGGGAKRPELWIPPGGRDELEAYQARLGHPRMFEETFALAEYTAGEPFRAAGFTLVAYPVEHYEMLAFGLRVEAPSGRRLGYSGDSGPCGGLGDVARGADLFLCEATLGDGADDSIPRGHLSAEEAIASADGARTVLTHRPAELPIPPAATRAVDGLEVEL